ncbi:dithiol-disulfide isomerase [Bacillus sp. FJAT-27225]|nr:ClpXP adapter SpxH family protein [Bacillus sp. FJAT-27225]OCA84249.1 dithiol-disulfide isomerase [Bacillus sp. FJAT-27225]
MMEHDKRFLGSQSPHHCHGVEKKPLEIYIFIDPLCPECWAMEPIMKKLQIEYGRYFTMKTVLSGKLTMLNMGKKKKFESMAQLWEKTASRSGMSCDASLWEENPVISPYIASIAIKAAELQGRKPGARFLRRLQEVLFLEKQNISNFDVLKDVARTVGLDVEEFITDIHSETAAKAFQQDLKITAEMEVDEIPTLVFFNQNSDEEGIKIAGYYPYEVYVQVLQEMLPEEPQQAPPPSLEAFMKFFRLVASKEIAVVYDLSIPQVDREMKKLLLKQKVEQIPAKHGTFWKYVNY